MTILVLNPGSSTLKFGLYREEVNTETQLANGIMEYRDEKLAALRVQHGNVSPREEAFSADSLLHAMEQATRRLLSQISEQGQTVDAVGCRVVHGGAQFVEPTRVTGSVLEGIRALAPLAPLHNPLDADVLEMAMRLLPNVPAVAVFDTAFHRTLPEIASTYALPHELSTEYGLRRYGFHGISHRYVSERLLEAMGRDTPGTRLIVCHLGNGASVCALREGKSIDTSMGLTPLEGLVMGTRSGDVDPGLLLTLLQTVGKSPAELDDLLNHQSGLRGLSGRSSDVRDLEQAAQQGDARAELALEVFAYRVSKYIGAYAAALEGLDAVAFTGGIGEHSAAMHQRICKRLAFLGLTLADDRNVAADGKSAVRISADHATVQGWVIPTDEERQIARETHALLSTGH